MPKVLPLILLLVAPVSLHAFELCFAPSTDPGGLGRNVSVNCGTTPDPFDNDWIGYSTNGPPCGTVSFCTLTLDYLWTLSTSETDPFENTGPLSTPGCLYLWYVCTNQNGLAAAAFDLVGDLTVLAIEPRNGFIYPFPETPAAVILAVGGCPTGPLLAGKVIVTSGPISVEDSSLAQIKALYR